MCKVFAVIQAWALINIYIFIWLIATVHKSTILFSMNACHLSLLQTNCSISNQEQLQLHNEYRECGRNLKQYIVLSLTAFLTDKVFAQDSPEPALGFAPRGSAAVWVILLCWCASLVPLNVSSLQRGGRRWHVSGAEGDGRGQALGGWEGFPLLWPEVPLLDGGVFLVQPTPSPAESSLEEQGFFTGHLWALTECDKTVWGGDFGKVREGESCACGRVVEMLGSSWGPPLHKCPL